MFFSVPTTGFGTWYGTEHLLNCLIDMYRGIFKLGSVNQMRVVF